MSNLQEIFKRYSLSEEEIIPYGYSIAKIKYDESKHESKRGKLILVTAMTPTKAGEGKTTTSISLADAMNELNYDAILALREPSLGPVFGVKGGGTGGGKSIIIPEDDINLHFTGDIHALTSANNLIASVIDNELYQHSELNIDKDRIVFSRAIDMNDRSLRDIETCLDPKDGEKHRANFVITAASEIMAIFCLSKDEEDFLDRVDNMLVAYSLSGEKIYVRDLKIRGSIKKLMHQALYPNLVRTLYGTPALVHGGPFANIAHGTNSIIATSLALKMSDYVITEAGFGSDLGMEKYLDIIVPILKVAPSLIVMVASIRALKLHGGIKFADLNDENLEALKAGYQNLKKHLNNVKLYNLPILVNINRFNSDTEAEIKLLESLLEEDGFIYSLNSAYTDGKQGALDAARKAKELADQKSEFKPLLSVEDDYFSKIDKVAKNIYGASDVFYKEEAKEKILSLEKERKDFSVCISKTPNSLSDDPKLLNVPEFTLHIRDVRIFYGAKFLVPLSGKIVTLPGLPKEPLAKKL